MSLPGLPKSLRRKVGRVEYWPTRITSRVDNGTRSYHVAEWGPVPGQGRPSTDDEQAKLL